MVDNNVLTYATKEVGNETDVPRCIGRVKSVYEFIKKRERGVRTESIETSKPISVKEIAEGVMHDMEDSERPSLGKLQEHLEK